MGKYTHEENTTVTADIIIANRYRIDSQLSQKAGRKTFLATDTQSDVRVIIKILSYFVSTLG
jgi:hypothetical protein